MAAPVAGDKLAYGIDADGVVHVSPREASAQWGRAKCRDRLCPTEKRVLSTIEWVIEKHNIDRNRVYLGGISMGGSGGLGIGMCGGDVFAAVSVAVPANLTVESDGAPR